ncbi:MAG: BrnA antitoxin family protein [Patescibacteria group bacterium]|nr:BrnA antitoxin family protein [Patescibacteria group bacterium]
MKKFKPIPNFKSEKEERQFWQRVDSTEYVDYSRAVRARFPNLKLTTQPITIRLPQSLIERLKLKARRFDLPYQSFIKQLLFEGIAKA